MRPLGGKDNALLLTTLLPIAMPCENLTGQLKTSAIADTLRGRFDELWAERDVTPPHRKLQPRHHPEQSLRHHPCGSSAERHQAKSLKESGEGKAVRAG